MFRLALIIWWAAAIAGCGGLHSIKSEWGKGLPTSTGEMASGYTYVPIDPFPVEESPGANCSPATQPKYGSLLESLPDNAVRMLVERFDTSGSVTYGVAKAAAKGESYRITVDYINADTLNMPIWISKYMRHSDGSIRQVNLISPPSNEFIEGTELYDVTGTKPLPFNAETAATKTEYNVPIYIGVGLRVSANIFVTGASANISGIGIIGAEAESEKVKGSLVVQTLGINGKSIAAALPIQSELNRTTAQNAIVSVGAIKALLYADETIKLPRVVGIYLPFPGGKPLVNAIISELSKNSVRWKRPCVATKPS